MAKSSSKIVLAVLAGLAAGVAVGVLVAPGKGSKTRKRLKKKFKDMEGLFGEGDLSDKLNSLKSIFKREKDDKTEHEPSATNSEHPNP